MEALLADLQARRAKEHDPLAALKRRDALEAAIGRAEDAVGRLSPLVQLQEAGERLEGALADLRRRRLTELYRSDGQPRYGREELAERERALLEGLRAASREAVAVAEREATAAERGLAKLAGTDVVETLTPEELARATALREFVREDCERLPAEELLARCTAAVLAGDRVKACLYAKYGRERGLPVRGLLAVAQPERAGREEELERRRRDARHLALRAQTIERDAAYDTPAAASRGRAASSAGRF